MCRRNKLCGFALIACGVGILIGQMVSSAFVCICGGLILAVVGVAILRQK